MNKGSHESGQALILIVFAIIGLVGITGLAVDGGMAYSDRRQAQNAADTSALAGALAHIRGRDPVAAAQASALNEGFSDDNLTNAVTVTVTNLALGQCPNLTSGKDITVQILSHSRAYFAPVLGIRQLSNTVRATARACDSYVGPMFPGNAIVALAPSGIGFDAAGTPDWSVTGGGIFSNSSGSPSARCKGATDVSAPSLTTVGQVIMACHSSIGSTSTGATPLRYGDYADLLPPEPKCNGTAKKVGNVWVAEPETNGSQVALTGGDMSFGPGLFCITNSPGPYHGHLDASVYGSGITFYIVPTNFSLKFAGGGSLDAQAPTDDPNDPYFGVLMFSKPRLAPNGTLLQTQSIDLRGNGAGSLEGSVIVPSANVTMFGNSDSTGNNTQVIAYHVDSGGNANINIFYDASLAYRTYQPAWLTLLR